MNKMLVLILLLLSGCCQSQNNQELILMIDACKIAGLRAVGLHTEDGLIIECRPYKNTEIET